MSASLYDSKLSPTRRIGKASVILLIENIDNVVI